MFTVITLAFLAFMVLGVPIAIAMGLAGFTAMLIRGDIPLEIAAQRFVTGTDSFTLLAMPFFILAGHLMNAGGITERLVRLANALVGHFRGGLAQVNVVANMIMAGMSGSAAADAAGSGAVLIPAMTRSGYSPAFAAAVTAAASTVGPIIPPSIPFVVYGVMTGASIGQLFLGGAVPGVLCGIYFMVVVYVISKKRGYPKGDKAAFKSVVIALKDGVPALMMPVIITWGIVGGIVTPTEAAVLAVVYALFLGVVVYRKLTLAATVRVFGEAALTTGTVLFIFAGASLLNWILTREQAGPALVRFVTSFTTERSVIIFALIIILLILGCFLEGLSLLILMVPVLMPLLSVLNMDLVHFGVVMVVTLMVGSITPPVGMSMFIGCAIAKIRVVDFAREIPLFVLAMVAVVLTIAYIPEIVLFLPKLLMGK
jgi:tripartite ATP-independent transporter DctM subunit